MFEVCYHPIFGDPQLAYLLVPSLVLLALGLGTPSKQEIFAKAFLVMIQKKLCLNPQFFAHELGPMAAELIYFIYDFIVDFEANRKLVHQYAVPNLVLRNRVNRFDVEYCGALAMLKRIKPMDVAKLAFAAKAYHKAMFYLERSYFDLVEMRVGEVAVKDFVQDNLDFIAKICSAMGDEDSVKGVKRVRADLLSTLEEMICAGDVETDSLTSLMVGSRMTRDEGR